MPSLQFQPGTSCSRKASTCWECLGWGLSLLVPNRTSGGGHGPILVERYGVLRQLLQLQDEFLSLPQTKDRCPPPHQTDPATKPLAPQPQEFVLDRSWPNSSSVDVDEFLQKQRDSLILACCACGVPLLLLLVSLPGFVLLRLVVFILIGFAWPRTKPP